MYLKMYRSYLWIAGLRVAFISSLIFSDIFFPTMYLSYNYLYKWKKTIASVKKKTTTWWLFYVCPSRYAMGLSKLETRYSLFYL